MSVRVGSVVDKWHWDGFLSKHSRLSPLSNIAPVLYIHSFIHRSVTDVILCRELIALLKNALQKNAYKAIFRTQRYGQS
jgi:hypothetical protein